MRKFVVTTISESGDHYMYFIKSKTVPTREELNSFLVKNGNDVGDEDECYEGIDQVGEITEDKFIELK